MHVLWRRDPRLAWLVDAVDDGDRAPLEPTRGGQWTARVSAPSGEPLYLHSRYDPLAEARTLAATVEVTDKFCYVVSGMGLGYHVAALLERLRGDVLVIVVEPRVETLAAALCCVDVSEAIEAGRLEFLIDDDKARLHERLSPHNALIMLGAQFLRHPPSVRLAEEMHARVTRAVGEFVSYTRMTLTTLVSNSKVTCRNIAMNLVTYASTPPIDALRGRFAGVPGVVVSAGPSLSKNIDGLKELQGKAVLIAVQTALKPLLSRGIRPDFATSLDFHEMSRRFFEGVDGLEGVHLVAEPKAAWPVIDAYPGPVSLLDSAWARLVIGDELGGRGGLRAGATVAHLAFYLAMYMGCDPVIFVGQDLAYTGHVFYTPGVEAHQGWRGELNRFQTLEQKEWERIVRNRPILRRVPGNDGGELYTDDLLFTYLEQFEKDIASAPCAVINATEGGARIRGSQVMSLGQATERHCGIPIDASLFDYRRGPRWRDVAKLPPVAAQIGDRIDELDEAVGICNELMGLFEELKGLTRDPDRFNRKLVRVDELRTRIAQGGRAFAIINFASQLAEFRRFSADRRLSASQLDDAERATRQLKRDAEFIAGVREGALEVREMLAAARIRIEAAMEPA